MRFPIHKFSRIQMKDFRLRIAWVVMKKLKFRKKRHKNTRQNPFLEHSFFDGAIGFFFFLPKTHQSWGKLLLLQVNNENFWIAALAVVAYVLFAGNVCCYNGSHNPSRPEISRGLLRVKRCVKGQVRFFKKPWLFGLSRRVILPTCFFVHMYLYGV